jgi:predicted dehydrogenase
MILRFHPLYRCIRALYQAGALSRLFLGAAHYAQQLSSSAPNYAWLVRSQSAGSAMFAGGVPVLDLLRWVVGAEVQEVYAYGLQGANPDFDYSPTVVGWLRFTTDLVASVSVCLEAPIGCWLRLELVGTHGIVRDSQLHTGWNAQEEFRTLPFDLPSADLNLAPLPAEVGDAVEAILKGGPATADLLISHEVLPRLRPVAGRAAASNVATCPAPPGLKGGLCGSNSLVRPARRGGGHRSSVCRHHQRGGEASPFAAGRQPELPAVCLGA